MFSWIQIHSGLFPLRPNGNIDEVFTILDVFFKTVFGECTGRHVVIGERVGVVMLIGLLFGEVVVFGIWLGDLLF